VYSVEGGMVGKPYDTVYKITALARWQRDWINMHRSDINYSGLVQAMVTELIESKDPEYFEQNKAALNHRKTRRRKEQSPLMAY